MRAEEIDTSIIIANWNAQDLLDQCLQSVYAAVSDLSCEVIVVDNGSTNGSATMVQDRFPDVRLIRNQENRGFAQANNQGINISTGRYVLLLNSDTIVSPDAVEQMVRFMDAYPDLGALGAELRNSDGSLQPSWAQFPTLLSEMIGRNFRVRRPFADGRAYLVDWVGGACLMVRRQSVEQVGLLDERLFMYSEETDWCYRMAQAGWQIGYLPGARVLHFGGASSRQEDTRMLCELYKSKLYFFDKHHGAGRREMLRTGMLLLTLLKMMVLLPQCVFGAKQRVLFGRQRTLFGALRRM